MNKSRQNQSGIIQNNENSSNIDVYDYCDKMMKELHHIDDPSAKNSKQQNIRYSTQSKKGKQNTNEILDGYL